MELNRAVDLAIVKDVYETEIMEIINIMHNEGCMAEQTAKQQICFNKNSLLLLVCNGKG